MRDYKQTMRQDKIDRQDGVVMIIGFVVIVAMIAYKLWGAA